MIPLQDYQAPGGPRLYGLEKFWAFHHYTGLPADGGIQIDPTVRCLIALRSSGLHLRMSAVQTLSEQRGS